MSGGRTIPARRDTRRRGSIYLATLGAAMIVTVIGLSALLAVRIQRRAGGATEAAVKARFCAQSTIDLALFLISQDPNWRTTHTNDVWTPQRTEDGYTFSYKLVDEQDGDLADDPSQPVRLYAKGIVGQAVRICSVRLEPERQEPLNLLINGDIENGITGWATSGFCEIRSSTDEPYGGVACLRVKNRWFSWSGPVQDVTGKLTNGATYNVEVWVRMASELASVRVTLTVSGMGTRSFAFVAPVGTTWTKVSGTLTPTWMGPITGASWSVATVGSIQDFKVDDARLVEATVPRMVPVPGTWRQEVLP